MNKSTADILESDNSLLESIDMFDQDSITTYTKKESTKVKSLNSKSSSGVSSQEFEFPDWSQPASNKRSQSTTNQPEKRIKTDEKPFAKGLLEDTLDGLNVTDIINKSNKSRSNAPKVDAFANYLQFPKQQSPENNHKDVSLSSTFFNTQILNEIDSTANKENSKESTSNMAKDALESNKFSNIEIDKRLQMFQNKLVTSDCRQEIVGMFEQIERTVCAMGENHSQLNISDEMLDLIFNKNTDFTQDDRNNLFLNATKSEELASADLSFGTLIKKALIANSAKSQLNKEKKPEPLNLTLAEKAVEFINLGPFYGLPLRVKQLIKQYKGIDNLYGWQDECLKLPAIERKKNLIYALPTSGGKTLVAEILMFRELLCYKRNAIFILPYVSIVQEKVWALSPFGVALDFLVEEYASSKGSYPPRKRRRKNSIYVATIEKALGLINSLIETDRLHEIGLVVVDEFHLIGEDGRGATLEAALTKILVLKANIQIIGMSATIGNLPDICKFLNAEAYTNYFRPVELTEYVKCENKLAKINWKYKDEEDLLVDCKTINFQYSPEVLKLDPDMLVGLVMEIVPQESCLVFCPSKKNCENVASLLSKLSKPDLKNHRRTEKQQILNNLKAEGGKLCNILQTSIKYGIAYHHSGLTTEERRIIEDGFRSNDICVICCTSTLAAGVNLPAKRVILRAPYVGRDFISLSRYKQMAGRAGRTGLGEYGESILIAQPQDMPKVVELIMSPMNKAHSGMHKFDGIGLRHFLLSCISLGIANSRSELRRVASRTLLAVQKEELNVDIKRITDGIIKSLFKLGALRESCGKVKEEEIGNNVSVAMDTSLQGASVVENSPADKTKKKKKTLVLKDDTKLVVSKLGCAAIKGGLELSKAHILYEDLSKAQSSLVLKGYLHLLYLITPYDLAEQITPNKQTYYEVFIRLNSNDMAVAKNLQINEAVAMKLLTNKPVTSVPKRVINRFYLTLMLYDLWNEVPVFTVAEKFQVNRGIVQNLMTSASTFSSNVVSFCEQLEELWAFAFLLRGMSQRLEHCCVKELLPLMDLPSVKQGRAKQLYNAGYKTLSSIAKANVNDLVEKVEFMSRKVADQLIAAAKMLLLERVENLREQAEDVLDGIEAPN
ncbi:unnamed protein product [Phyllotreta striolata]|uniref:Helicase POLQ-like n=1 Tax=Phyllotreta striolata TaxID=444603 RepID=A0A9N9XPH7_PHYSR|nr:unnamed protein product [Phyllotreta striolata]